MEYSHFSHLDIKLSKLGFGGAALSGVGGGYGFGEIGEKAAEKLINMAIDVGINVFDTAPIYGFNLSEIRMGNYLKSHRDNIHLISKAGITWHSSKRVNLSNEPKVIEQMLHDSLRNLQTDYIDTYMIHWPDPRVDIRYSLEVLKKAQDQGKIRFIGLCNTNQEDLDKAKEVCKVHFLQSECNLFHNAFHDLKITDEIIMGWGTLDKGILAGTVTLDSKFSDEDARSWAPWWKKSHWKDKVKKIDGLKRNFKYDVFDLALKYSMQNTNISLCGFKNSLQLERLLKVSEKEISNSVLDEVVKYVRS